MWCGDIVRTFLCFYLVGNNSMNFSKFAQGRHTFICDFVSTMKLVVANLFTMYCDTNKSYVAPHSSTFLDLVEHTIKDFHLTWWTDPISQIKFFRFFFSGKLYLILGTNASIRVVGMINKESWVVVVHCVKWYCFEAATGFITELEKCFPAQELMIVIKIIDPQYWLAPKAETTFARHLAIIQAHFGHPKTLGTIRHFVGPLLDPILLDKQISFLKLTMPNHCHVT